MPLHHHDNNPPQTFRFKCKDTESRYSGIINQCNKICHFSSHFLPTDPQAKTSYLFTGCSGHTMCSQSRQIYGRKSTQSGLGPTNARPKYLLYRLQQQLEQSIASRVSSFFHNFSYHGGCALASASGASKINSSCTWRSIFVLKPASCKALGRRIIARFIMSAALP